MDWQQGRRRRWLHDLVTWWDVCLSIHRRSRRATGRLSRLIGFAVALSCLFSHFGPHFLSSLGILTRRACLRGACQSPQSPTHAPPTLHSPPFPPPSLIPSPGPSHRLQNLLTCPVTSPPTLLQTPIRAPIHPRSNPTARAHTRIPRVGDHPPHLGASGCSPIYGFTEIFRLVPCTPSLRTSVAELSMSRLHPMTTFPNPSHTHTHTHTHPHPH